MSGSPEVGALLQRYRRANGLTQEKLAEVVGTTTNHLARIEQGSRAVTFELIQKLEENRAEISKGDLAGLQKAFEAFLEAKNDQPRPKKISMLSVLENFDSELSSNYDALMLEELYATSNAPWLMFEKLIVKLHTSLLHPRFSDSSIKVPQTHVLRIARYLDKWHGFYHNLYDSEFGSFEEEHDGFRSYERDVSESVAKIFDRILEIVTARVPSLKEELKYHYIKRKIDDSDDKPSPPSGWGAEASADDLDIDEIPF